MAGDDGPQAFQRAIVVGPFILIDFFFNRTDAVASTGRGGH